MREYFHQGWQLERCILSCYTPMQCVIKVSHTTGVVHIRWHIHNSGKAGICSRSSEFVKQQVCQNYMAQIIGAKLQFNTVAGLRVWAHHYSSWKRRQSINVRVERFQWGKFQVLIPRIVPLFTRMFSCNFSLWKPLAKLWIESKSAKSK